MELDDELRKRAIIRAQAGEKLSAAGSMKLSEQPYFASHTPCERATSLESWWPSGVKPNTDKVEKAKKVKEYQHFGTAASSLGRTRVTAAQSRTTTG